MSLELTLGKAVAEARRRRYEERLSNVTGREQPRDLFNQCVRNTYILSEVLGELDVNHQIIRGGLDSTDLDDPPGTVQRTRDEGFIHYWCETLSEPRYIIDIASEVDERDGLPIITQQLPSRYLYLVDGTNYTFTHEPAIE